MNSCTTAFTKSLTLSGPDSLLRVRPFRSVDSFYVSPRQYNTALRFSLGYNCTLSLPLVSILRGTNKFLNQRQGLILKVVKSQQRLSLMGLGGNIGTWEWGLFALEITHYLPPRSPPSPIRKYNALYLQKYLLSNT